MTSRPPARYTAHTGPRAFDLLRPAWNSLLARSAFNSIFLTWEWQTAWWDCLGQGAAPPPDASELILLELRAAADDETIGIAPLYALPTATGWHLQLVGCTEVADYLDIISVAGREAEVLAGFLGYLTSADAPAWDAVTLCNLYEPSLTPRLLPDLAAAAGLRAEVQDEDVAPYLLLPATFDAYLESLDKKQRHEIRRKRNKIDREAEHWRWFSIRTEQDLDAWIERFIALHRLTSAAKDEFMTPDMAAFFRRIAHVAARQGWLNLAFIEINGDLAAAYFNFDFDRRMWVYNSGFDLAAHGQFSPGIILNACLIEDAIATDHRVFDFLQGNEIYKYRFGATDARVARVVISR